MRRGSLRVVAALVACGLARALPASAWGDEGHEIVCAIARDLLEARERGEIDRLTHLYRRPDGVHYADFSSACTFADLARGKAREGVRGWKRFERFKNWHFLNVPRDARRIEARSCRGDCVLEAIDYHSRRCADSRLQDWKRAEALFFLAHWVADVHQPLHVSYLDDHGGNDIGPIRGRYYPRSDLHYVWDTGILRKALGGSEWRVYAAELRAAVPPAHAEWNASAPLAWAQESYDLATASGVDYCEWTRQRGGELCRPEPRVPTLDAAYQHRFQRAVENRLQRAAVRLAERLRRCVAR